MRTVRATTANSRLLRSLSLDPFTDVVRAMHESDAAHFAVEKESNDAQLNQSDLLKIQASFRTRRCNTRFQEIDVLEKYSPKKADNLPIAV